MNFYDINNPNLVPYSSAGADQEVKPDFFSVSQALSLANEVLENVNITVVGEISENPSATSAAVYFPIKDENSSMPCMIWQNVYRQMDIDFKVGTKIEVCGKFGLWTKNGRLSFRINSAKYAGEGNLRAKIEELKNKLIKEGLTDSSRKKPIPKFCARIGVVTSPRGAVIHDVKRTLQRRMPIAKIVFCSTLIEGPKAPGEIIKALEFCDNANCDVVLLIRGGGSFEDLLPFNDEMVARKVANLMTPVITAVGHETDTSLVDLVSDLRASTPTAAAEAVSINFHDYTNNWTAHLDSIKKSILNGVCQNAKMLESIASRPIFKDPNQLFAQEFISLDFSSQALKKGLKDLLTKYNNKISIESARLHDKSPLVILSRGYAAAKNSEGKIVKNIAQVSEGEKLSVRVSDGVINTNVETTQKLEGDSI